MKSQEIRLQRSITYTSKQGADPEALERFKKQAEEEMKAESQALFQARRQKLLQRGFELLDENTLVVDVGQVWRWNLRRIRPYSQRIAGNVNLNEPLYKFMLSFVQEIPYKKPPDQRSGLVVLGVLPPVEALAAGYGDCDTKSLLFASLVDDGRGPEVILLRGPEHMIAAVECGESEAGYKIKVYGKVFLLCECSHGVWLPGQIAPGIHADIEKNLYRPIRLRSAERNPR